MFVDPVTETEVDK